MTSPDWQEPDRGDDRQPEDLGFLDPPRSLNTRLIMLVTGGFCILVGLPAAILGPASSPPVQPWYLISVLGMCILALGMGLMWKPMATRKHTNLAYLIGLGALVVGSAWARSHLALRDVEQRERDSQEYSRWSAIDSNARRLAAEATFAEITGDAAKAAELYGQAAAEYRRALAYAERSFGPESSSAVLSMTSLAGVEAKRGQPEAADALYRQALAICRKTGEKLDLVQVAKEYAMFLRERGREDEARQVEALSRPGAPAAPSSESSRGPR